MAELQWPQIIVSFLSGGACGAILRIAYERWQARHQPVLTRIEVDRVFSSSPYDSDLQANVTVLEESGVQVQFSNLSLVKVEIVNGGNADRETFDFGITLPNGHRAIRSNCSGSDRYHSITCANGPSLSNQCSIMDFCCKPFNRKDAYVLKLYVNSELKTIQASDVQVSTAAPVRITTNADQYSRTVMRLRLLNMLALIIAVVATVSASELFEFLQRLFGP